MVAASASVPALISGSAKLDFSELRVARRLAELVHSGASQASLDRQIAQLAAAGPYAEMIVGDTALSRGLQQWGTQEVILATPPSDPPIMINEARVSR